MTLSPLAQELERYRREGGPEMVADRVREMLDRHVADALTGLRLLRIGEGGDFIGGALDPGPSFRHHRGQRRHL